MRSIFSLEGQTRHYLTAVGGFVSLLLLRLLLGYEFFESGAEKYSGDNWFTSLEFPFPFSILSADVNWFLATWFELIGAVLLIVGLATRYVSLSLIVLTIVAIYTAHMPETLQVVDGESQWTITGIGSIGEFFDGYRISEKCADGYCTGNYKLPVMYLIMFVPLLLSGAGRLSIDHWLKRRYAD